MTKFEKRIQDMYMRGYTVQRLVNELHSEIGVSHKGKKTKQEVRELVESALTKIKWEE